MIYTRTIPGAVLRFPIHALACRIYSTALVYLVSSRVEFLSSIFCGYQPRLLIRTSSLRKGINWPRQNRNLFFFLFPINERCLRRDGICWNWMQRLQYYNVFFLWKNKLLKREIVEIVKKRKGKARKWIIKSYTNKNKREDGVWKTKNRRKRKLKARKFCKVKNAVFKRNCGLYWKLLLCCFFFPSFLLSFFLRSTPGESE